MHPTKTARRRLAALASGTLAVGALTLAPAVTGLSVSAAATGAVDYTCDITMTGGFASYGGEKAASITFDTDAPESVTVGSTVTPTLSVSITLDPAFAAQFGPSPVNQMKAVLTGTTSTAGAAGTVPITTETWQRGGGMNSPVPALILTGTGAWPSITPTETGAHQLGIGALTGTLQMATTFAPATFTSYAMTCTPDGADPVVDTLTVNERTYSHSCSVDLSVSGYGTKQDYPADLSFDVDAPETAYPGEPFAATVDATLTFGDAFVDYVVASPVKRITGVADAPATAGGTTAAVPLTFGAWDRVLGDGSPMGQPIESIVLTGTGTWAGITPTAPGALPLSATGLDGDLTLTVVYGNMTALAPIVCTPAAGTQPTVTTVDVLAPQAMATPVRPAVSGVRKVGSPLAVSTGTWTPADVTLTYRWLRNGVLIPGATGRTYVAVPADLGKSLVARVVATRSGYVTTTVTAAAGTVAAGSQRVTGTPKVAGAAKVGKKLSVRPGSAPGAKVAVQWLANGKPVKKATGGTLKLTKALKGKKVSVRVSYVRAGYATVVQTSKAVKIKK